MTITDTGATITETAPECTGDTTNTVVCTPPAGATVESSSVDLGDGNDVGTANGAIGGLLDGDEGDDNLTGSDTNTDGENVTGGNGNDGINTRNVGAPADPFGFGFTNGDFATGDDDGGDPAGDGNDVIFTGNGNDFVSGEGGVDAISTGAGQDNANGDEGDGDRIDLGPGDDSTFLSAGTGDGVSDVVEGGDGFDSLSYQGASNFNPPTEVVIDALTVDLTAGTASRTSATPTPESNTVAGFEDLNTGTSTDNVNGTAGSNAIETGFGNDVVNPQGGADAVFLGSQDDTANTVDGSSDRVFCGPGADTVTADQFDEVSADCENVPPRTIARPAGADEVAPVCKTTRVKRNYNSKAFRRGIRARVACNETATVTLQILVGVKGGKIITSKVGDLVLAEKTVTIGPAAKSTRLKPRKKLAVKLPKRFKGRVKIDARDEFGNRSVKNKRIKVKPSKKGKKNKGKRKRKG